MGKSHQSGWIVLRGKRWYGYYRKQVIDPTTEDVRVSIIPVRLGLKAQMTKLAARDALRVEIAKQTGKIADGKGWNGHLRMVCSQPLLSAPRGRMAARNGTGEESSDRNRPDFKVRLRAD